MEKELLDVTKKTGIVFFGGMIANVLSLVFNLIVARLIGAKSYGEFTYVFTFISLIPIIGALGFSNGLIYSIPKLKSNNKIKEQNSLISFCLLTVFILSVFLSLLIGWQSNFIAKHLLNKGELTLVLKVMTPLIIFLTFIPVLNGAFIGSGKIKVYVLAQSIINPLVKTISVFMLALVGFKLWGLVAATYIATISGILILLINLSKNGFLGEISKEHWGEYKKILVFSSPVMLAAIMVFMNNKMNTFMIGYYLPSQQVGIFNVAWKVGWTSVFIYMVFNSMFAPMISALFHRGEIHKLGELYKTITKWVVMGNLIVLGLVLLFSADIMHIFGKEFIVGSTALIIITLGQVVNAATGSAASINTMTGHPSYELYCNGIGIFIGVILNYLLIPHYGINGAAVATFVTIGVMNIMRVLLVYRDHRIHPYSWSYIKVIGSCVLSYLLILSLKNLININWFVKLISLSTLYLLSFIAFSLIFGLSADDKLVIGKVFAKFKRISV